MFTCTWTWSTKKVSFSFTLYVWNTLVSSLENLFDIVSAYQKKIIVVFLHGNLDHRILSYVKKILKVPSKSNMSFWRKILKVTLELYLPANTKEYQQTTDNSFSFFLCAGKYNLNGTFSIFLQKSTFYWMCKTPFFLVSSSNCTAGTYM